MIIDAWEGPITPGKEAEALDSWTRLGDELRKQFPGHNCRAARAITGNTYRVVLLSEFESIAERDEVAANLNDEVNAIVSKMKEQKYIDYGRMEHHYYEVLE